MIRSLFTALLLLGTPLMAAASADRPQPGEAYPGGATTHIQVGPVSADAFSHSAANIEFDDKMTFALGRAIFRKLWVSSPSSTTASDGLGPLYNARSCQRCHLKNGRGRPPESPNDNTVSLFLRLSIAPRSTADLSILQQRGVVPEPAQS